MPAAPKRRLLAFDPGVETPFSPHCRSGANHRAEAQWARNRDENSARRWPGPKPTPNDHSPSAATEIVAYSEAPRRPKPTRKSSLDWVMLQFDAEAPNLHVTAAHGYRTPKCSKPHAAYRRDRAATEAVALSLPPRGNPECPLSVSPKRPIQRSPQYRRAAEATRWWLPNTPAAEATVAPPHLFPCAEASERPCNCETRR